MKCPRRRVRARTRSSALNTSNAVASLSQVLLTAWAGSLWTICGLVVPLLFATLDDRRLAGNIAGLLFEVESWVAAAFGAAFILVQLRHSRTRDTRLLWVSAISLTAPLTFYFFLRPIMAAARAAGDMTRFGLLHSVGGLLFLIACAGTLWLVIRFKRPAG